MADGHEVSFLPRKQGFRRRSVRRAVLVAVSLVGVLGSTAGPALAVTRPVNWGSPAATNPYAADAASARSYSATWGWPQTRIQTSVPAFPVGSIKAPLALKTATAPTDATSVLMRKTLNTSLRYMLTTWWQQRFGKQLKAKVFNLGGTDEYHVRGPAMEAYALAIALKTGGYQPTVTGVPLATAQADAVKLVTSLVDNHLANNLSGWGIVWQSPLWSAMAGTAAWLLWDKLDVPTRTAAMKMVVQEADIFNNFQVPYYQSPDGTILSPGDTKAEEDSWDSMILQVAVAMMPTHPYASIWSKKNVELQLAAYARPQDLTDSTVINGQPLSAWLQGSNINPDGTLVNHGIIHPDYMATVIQNLTAPLVSAFAGQPAPIASLHNADVVYGAMTNVTFAAPPYRAPGGTIYVPNSASLYYPQSDDWGTSRIAHTVALDEMAADLHLDDLAAVPAATELDLHLQKVASMQARSKDGRSYVTASEDTYNLREEWVAYHLGLAWLTRWTTSNSLVSFTNNSVLSQ